MALSTGLNRSRSAIVFVVNEVTAGTINAYPADADRFGLTTAPVIGQSGNYTDTSEIGPELISVDRVLNYMEYSTFDFEFYAKPGGQTLSAAFDLTGQSTTGTGTTTTSVSLTNDPGVSAGDTILVASDDAAATGYFTVTNPAGAGPYTFDFVTATATGVNPTFTSIKKVTLAMPEEHNILNRCFGGVKYMSRSHNGYLEGALSATGVTQSNAGIVQYYLSNTIQTMTVTSRQFTDDSVQMYTAAGALPTSWSVSLAKDGPVTYSTGFQSSRVYYAGTAELNLTYDGGNGAGIVSNSGATVLKVISPKRHASNSTATAEDIAWYHSAAIGSLFMLKNNGAIVVDNLGKRTVFEVSAAISNDLVTVEVQSNAPVSNVTLSTSAFLIPYTPEPCPDTTAILDQRKVQVFMTDELTGTGLNFVTTASTELFNSANELDVTAVSWDFDRSISTPALTEMTGEEFPPASYVINEPTVSGSFTLLLRPKDFQLMNSLRAEPHRAFGVRIGSTEGKIIEMAAPSVFMEIPTPADADGATQIDIPFTVVRGQECEDADKFFIRYR
jgi:hypothetical protein